MNLLLNFSFKILVSCKAERFKHFTIRALRTLEYISGLFFFQSNSIQIIIKFMSENFEEYCPTGCPTQSLINL